MAKTSKNVSGRDLTAKVIEFVNSNPSLGPKEVAESLTAEGLDLDAQKVSAIKYNHRDKLTASAKPSKRRSKKASAKKSTAPRAKAAKRATTTTRATTTAPKGSHDEVKRMFAMKEFADNHGGVDEAIGQLTLLKQILKD